MSPTRHDKLVMIIKLLEAHTLNHFGWNRINGGYAEAQVVEEKNGVVKIRVRHGYNDVGEKEKHTDYAYVSEEYLTNGQKDVTIENIKNIHRQLERDKKVPQKRPSRKEPNEVITVDMVEATPCPKCKGTGVEMKSQPKNGTMFPVDCEDCEAGVVWVKTQRVDMTRKKFFEVCTKEYTDEKTGKTISYV